MPAVSPSGPRAATSPLRSTVDGTAVTSARRARTASGSPSASAIGRSASGSIRTRTGPSRRKASASCSASVWPCAPRAMPSLSQTELACSRPGVCWPAPRARPRDRPAMAAAASRAGLRARSRAAMSVQLDTVVGRRGSLQEQHLPALALGLLQQVARDCDPLVPISRRSPAIVDDQQQRSGAAQARGRVQDRPGQGQDQQCRDGQAQQQEPPGRARWRAFWAEQAQRAAETAERRCVAAPAGSPAAAARGPEGRRPAGEQPGLREGESAEGQHRQATMRGASMPISAESARSAVPSVRWLVKRQPWRPAIPARLSRCAWNSSA